MRTISSCGLAAALVQAANAHRDSGALRTRLLDLAHAVRQAYLHLFGIPDYERYAAHLASHHPGDPVLSRREFYARSIDRKYCRSGPRCC